MLGEPNLMKEYSNIILSEGVSNSTVITCFFLLVIISLNGYLPKVLDFTDLAISQFVFEFKGFFPIKEMNRVLPF